MLRFLFANGDLQPGWCNQRRDDDHQYDRGKHRIIDDAQGTSDGREHEADFAPRIDHTKLKIVGANDEADQLEAEGFEFRSHFPNATRMLDSGAIAFCIFSGSELANIGWVALSQRAMDSLPDPPFKVDFANNEACGGAIWTSPEYRRNGFRLYNRYKRFEFLLEKGFLVNRSAIAKRNVVAQSGYRKFPPTRTYGEDRYLRVLWWKSWRERPLAA